MTETTRHNIGTICPICSEFLDPIDRNRWDDHLQAVLCQHCFHDLWYWLTTHESPEQILIDKLEDVYGKPYWHYQIAVLSQKDDLDEDEQRILRDALAKKRRSELYIIK